MKSDIYNALVEYVGCEYISDLREGIYNLSAKNFLANINVNEYDLSVLSDIAEYIFGESACFDTYDDASNFFKSKTNGSII